MEYTILFGAIFAIILIAALFIVLRATSSPSKAIPAIISVVVVIALVAVVVPLTNNDVAIPSTLQYDDYYDADGISSASGSLELWTDGNGKTWLHAAGVGDGSYTKDGATYDVTVDKAPLVVVLSLGQSNGAYRTKTADPDTAKPVAPLGSCYYYGDSQRPLNYGKYYPDMEYGMYSMTSKYNTAKVGDFDEPFAAQFYKDSGLKIYVINACVEGSNISSWVPGASNYEYAQTIFAQAVAAIDTDHFTPITYVTLWNQGEGDKTTAIDTYKSKLLSIYDDLKDGTFDNSIPIETMLIVKTRSVYVNPSTAQIELANETSGIYLASSVADTFTVANGKMNADDVHYSQLGDNDLGVSVANFYYEEVIE